MDELLRDILSHLRAVQTSYKGSMGGIGDYYLPQLDVKRVDELVARVREEIDGDPSDLP